MFKMLRNNKRGFTLVELIVVIVVLGILAAIGIPRYNDYVTQAKYSSLMADIKTVENSVAAMQMSREDGELPTDEVIEFTDLSTEVQTDLTAIGEAGAEFKTFKADELANGLKNSKKAVESYAIITNGDREGTVFLKKGIKIKAGVLSGVKEDRVALTGLEDLLPTATP